ncbi:MAG: YfcC family protein [Anaerovorax sp.]|nr:YfcC family protein [Anaerovorax sp.]
MKNDKTKKGFKLPSSTVMLFVLICIVTIMTYVVPAGQFDTMMNEKTGTEMIDASSYHVVDQSPVSPFRMFVAIQEGFINGASIIFLILFGYFWVYSIMQTGAFSAMIKRLLAGKAKDSKWFIPIVMTIFALAGSTYGEFETIYGLIPIFVALSIALGYDALVGLSISGMAVAVGFASATTNPFTLGIAQSFGELPIFSGLWLRWIVFVVFLATAILWVMRYATKIKKDPSKSLVCELDYSSFRLDIDEDVSEFTVRHKILMLGMVLTVGIIVFGSLKLNWYINEMSGVFLISGLLSSIIAGNGPEKIASNFLTACSEMTVAMIVVGLSRTILVILQGGTIIDTIIYALNAPMKSLPNWITAEMMLIIQNILNFFIPSGSGQATAIMPIMIPLADLAGLNRQVAVLAYQFGDGFSNLIWPTAACSIMCGIAKIPLGKLYRYFLPLFGVMFVLQSAFLIFAALINYGPF